MKSKKVMSSVRAVVTVGGASVLNVLLGLLKMKFAALILGPSGVGLIGILQQIMSTFAILFGLDLRNAGTRQVAEVSTRDSQEDFATVRCALFLGSLSLAFIGATTFFVFSDSIRNYFLENTSIEFGIEWVSLGIFLTIISSGLQALLNGLRKVNELAIVTVSTGATSTVIAIGSIYFFVDYSILIFVIASPIASYLSSKFFVLRLPSVVSKPVLMSEVLVEFWKMGRLGSTIMLATLVVSMGHLAIRAFVQREYGESVLGLFTAAWLISQYYIGFIYVAITMDFYPRLTSIISDRVESSKAINHQAEIGLLFSAPLFILMISCAPYFISILYSEDFLPAASILRLLVIGDVLKVLAYPMEFALFAAAAGKSYLMLRVAGILVLVFGSYYLLPSCSLDGVGYSYILMYAVYLPFLYLCVVKLTGFALSKRVALLALSILLSVTSVFFVSSVYLLSGLILGAILSLVFMVIAWRRLRL